MGVSYYKLDAACKTGDTLKDDSAVIVQSQQQITLKNYLNKPQVRENYIIQRT